MKIKYNYFFIPFLIILIAGYYFLSSQEEQQEASKRLSDRSLINFETIGIIEIISPDMEIRLEKVGDTGEGDVGSADDWRMATPFRTGCNPESLAALIDALRLAESERDIPYVTPEQIVEYGLDNPGLRVKVSSAESGDVMMNLALGKENSAGTSRYATFENTDTVFMVPIYHVEAFGITPEDIRDRRAMRFDRDDIVAIQLSSAQEEIFFDVIDSAWKVTSPRLFSANPSRMDIFFHDLEELQADEFLPDGTSDPHFDTTNIEVLLTTSTGEQHDLNIYGEDIQRGYFAQSSWQPSPFIVEAYIYSRLAVNSDKFFYTVLIDIAPAAMTNIHLRQPGAENVEIERNGTRENDWTVLKPNRAVVSEENAFSTFIVTLLAMKPDSSVPQSVSPGDMGLTPSFFLKIEVASENGDTGTLKLGSRDDYGSYYATIDDISFITIPAQQVDAFLDAADNLRIIAPEEE